MRRSRIVTLLSAAVLAISSGLAKDDKKPKNPKHDVEKIGERDVSKGVNLYSLEKEIQLGRTMSQEVERTSKILSDPLVSEYVNRLGQNLVRNSDAKVPFTIKVIDSEEINAFALPGGFFYLNSGLIRLAKTDAELAGVMAHEIAHVNARHGTRQASRAQITQWASIPLIFMGGGWGAYGAQQAANLAVPLTFLKFSRGFEHEADLFGVQYLFKAGYDPNEMISFFERLQSMEKKKKGTLAKAFSTHPVHGDRIKKVQDAIRLYLPERPEYAITSSEFAEVKERLDTVTARGKTPDDPSKPTLRRKPSGTISSDGDKKDKSGESEDEKPTLKRRNAVGEF
ncbi:MAG: M48 family metallopeptidase [Bryobacteraceae bacterium]